MDPSPQRERDEGKSCHPSARYISLLAARRGRPGSGRSSIVGECDLSCNLAASQVPGFRKGGGAQEYGTSTLHAHEIDLEWGILNSMAFEYYSVSGLLLFSPPSSSSIPYHCTIFAFFASSVLPSSSGDSSSSIITVVVSEQPAIETRAFQFPLVRSQRIQSALMGLV
jgi:hypothetical protein